MVFITSLAQVAIHEPPKESVLWLVVDIIVMSTLVTTIVGCFIFIVYMHFGDG